MYELNFQTNLAVSVMTKMVNGHRKIGEF